MFQCARAGFVIQHQQAAIRALPLRINIALQIARRRSCIG
jgi:hypothetical protein